MSVSGWALQAGTSHFLGQQFAKAFDVTYMTAKGDRCVWMGPLGVLQVCAWRDIFGGVWCNHGMGWHREHVWATSWGVSTRLVGGLIMTHSDDTGLVLPPALAPVQVDIVPITLKNKPDVSAQVLEAVFTIRDTLKSYGIRAHVDDRDTMTPGAKFFESERKGTPLRIEVGPRDLKNNVATLKTRIGGDRVTLQLDGARDVWLLCHGVASLFHCGCCVTDRLAPGVSDMLDTVQSTLLATATDRLAKMTHRGCSYAEMKEALAQAAGQNAEAPAGFFLVPWHDDAEAEAAVQADSKATLRCFPFDCQDEAQGQECFYSGRPATHMAIFARAY